MVRTIECHADGLVIQKISTPYGKFIAYQAGVLGNTATMDRYNFLSEARKAIGVDVTPESKDTKPKLSYAQNQKGYDPHSKR
jgi:hypothetical protein